MKTSQIKAKSFLEMLMPQACQRLRDIWTMSLITCFNFWSALKWSSSEARWSLSVPSNWTKKQKSNKTKP